MQPIGVHLQNSLRVFRLEKIFTSFFSLPFIFSTRAAHYENEALALSHPSYARTIDNSDDTKRNFSKNRGVNITLPATALIHASERINTSLFMANELEYTEQIAREIKLSYFLTYPSLPYKV